MSGNDEENWPDIWYWWKVKNGEWMDVGQEFDHVDGTIEEMAKDLGAIRLPFSGQYHTVYRLDYRVTREMIVEYDSIRALANLSRDKGELTHHIDALWDSFEEKSPAHAWYSTYGHIIYPDTHLVFAVYGNVEGHGILCATFKDMLDVVGQLNSIAGAK